MENFSAHYAYVHDTVRPVSQDEKLISAVVERYPKEDLKST